MQNPHKFFIGKHTVLNGDKIACMSRGVGALDNPDLDYTYVYYAGSMEPDRLYGTFALDVWDWYVNFAKYHNLTVKISKGAIMPRFKRFDIEFTHEDYDLQLRCYKSSWGMPHWNLSVRKNDQWLVSRGPFFTIASAIHEGVQYINKYGK